MNSIFDNFKFEPDGTTTLADALCNFIKDEISVGRIKGGERIPTISEISKATGLTFSRARRMVERLAKEGFVRSRTNAGTVVLSRGENMLRGRVLMALPDVDRCRYHPNQLMDILGRKLTTAGYTLSTVTFSIDGRDKLKFLKSELQRSTDLVIAARATPAVQKYLAQSGVNHVFVYGDKPESKDRPWIRFSPDAAISLFADHCARAGVSHVVQVRFEDYETPDAGPALAKKGIDSSLMTISRGNSGKGLFDGIVHCAYRTFESMPYKCSSDLLLFWNSFLTQGAVTAFLANGIRLPEDIKVVTLSDTGLGPVYTKPFTRFEIDPVEAGGKVADFALAMLSKRRLPQPPEIVPQYVFGETFPF